MFLKQLRISILSLVVLTITTGLFYPLAITGICQVIFPKQANGSLILGKDGTPVGSELIGQNFDAPQYFWSRPSATGPMPYNAAASSGSNLGPTNPAFLKGVQDRVTAIHAADPDNHDPIPVDLATASGSGLDPAISPAAAEYQLKRVARMRRMQEPDVEKLIQENTKGRFLGFMGEPAVNVLKLNLALDHVNS